MLFPQNHFLMPELNLYRSLIGERYAIQRRLSQSRYAELFVAEDRLHQRAVVIKALNPDLEETADADLERKLIENFANEAHILDLVRHPNVVLRLDAGVSLDRDGCGFNYIVLEYMVGGDLLKHCQEHHNNCAMPLGAALLFVRQACEALAYAHSRGVIHRDIKPNNLLLSADYRLLKVADFGVAKLAVEDDPSDELTRVGSPLYAPPEHHPDNFDESEENLTPSADVYSLAKTFYTIICGGPPRQFSRRPITALPPRIAAQPWGEQLLTVLRRATADRIEQRYSGIGVFWDDLARVGADRPTADLIAGLHNDDERTLVKTRLRVQPGPVAVPPHPPQFRTFRNLRHARRNPIVVDLRPPATPATPEPTENFATMETTQPMARTRLAQPTAPLPQPARPAPGQYVPPPPPTFRQPQPAAPPVSYTRRRKRSSAGWLMLLILLAAAGTAGYYGYRRYQSGPISEVEALVDINVREGLPRSGQFDSLGIIGKGSRQKVLESSDNWRKIAISDWSDETKSLVNVNQGVVLPCSGCLSVEVLAEHLTVRDTVTSKAKVVGAVPRNSVHNVLAARNGYLQVRVSNWSDDASSGVERTAVSDLGWLPISKENARLIVDADQVKVYMPMYGKLVRLGAVARGTTHRLLDSKGGALKLGKESKLKLEDNWIPLEVSQWHPTFARIGSAQEGWITGEIEKDVKVTRRSWR